MTKLAERPSVDHLRFLEERLPGPNMPLLPTDHHTFWCHKGRFHDKKVAVLLDFVQMSGGGKDPALLGPKRPPLAQRINDKKLSHHSLSL